MPREFIVQAMERIKAGLEEVERYHLGAPTMKGTCDIAKRLWRIQ